MNREYFLDIVNENRLPLGLKMYMLILSLIGTLGLAGAILKVMQSFLKKCIQGYVNCTNRTNEPADPEESMELAPQRRVRIVA